jgi:hypothetical protein
MRRLRGHSHNGFPDCGPEFQLRRTERNLLTWARAAYFCGAGGFPCLTCVRQGGGGRAQRPVATLVREEHVLMHLLAAPLPLP